MNVIVKKHYPVERLPADLKDAVGGAATVTLTLEPDDRGRYRSLDEIKSRLDKEKSEGRIESVTPEEAVARVRKLRDEWDR